MVIRNTGSLNKYAAGEDISGSALAGYGEGPEWPVEPYVVWWPSKRASVELALGFMTASILD